MIGRGIAAARQTSMGDQNALSDEQSCGADSCQGLRVVTVGDENLCCDHFLSRCYELLGRIDPKSGVTDAAQQPSKEKKELVEECSRKALEVSLGTPALSNLQRARLLDILLWASDLSSGATTKTENPWGLSKAVSAPADSYHEPVEAQKMPRTSICY